MKSAYNSPMNSMHSDSSNETYEDEPVSDTLERVAKEYGQSSRITMDELIFSLRHRGFGLLMLVLVLPNCVPVPIPPGGSTLLSIPLFFIALQMLWGKHSPWLPKWLRRQSFERKTVDKIVTVATPKLRWVEKFLKPRWSFTSTKTGEQIVGFIWLIFAISIAIPLPMTNFIPGIGTLVMALGLLGRDGVVVIIGAIIGFAGVTFTTLLLTVGAEAVITLFPFLSGTLS